ncbi:MAG: protein kinase [Polyangiales bacterium]
MNASEPSHTPARWSLPGLELLARVGVGGHAEVWRARHVRSRMPVAVKVLSRIASSEEAALAFQTELLAIAQLRHPHVVRLLDYDTDCPGAPPFVVMEWAEGTLHRARPRNFEGLTRWLDAILSALAHAHAVGVVHCDVKPRNVLLVDGRPKLADFGIARLREAGPAMRRPKVWGTPAYAAPELFAAPWCVGPWTDLYATGITAFELVSGTLPFGDRTDAIRGHAAPLPELVPRFAVPEGLADWLATLCAKEPANRFQRAAEAQAALRHLGRGVRSSAVRVARAPRAPATTVNAVLDGGPASDGRGESAAAGTGGPHHTTAVGVLVREVAPGSPEPASPWKLLPQQVVMPAVSYAQVWLAPAASKTAPLTPALTGESRTLPTVIGSPSPICPLPAWPQHHTSPSGVRPQVWPKPAVSATRSSAPSAGPGTKRLSMVPSPSSRAAPQHETPVADTAQACVIPAVTTLVPARPSTSEGVRVMSWLPVPFCPSSLRPQQNAVPFVRTPQVCDESVVPP